MMKTTKWFAFDEVLHITPYDLLAPSPNKTPALPNIEKWFLNMLSVAGLQVRYVGIKSNGSIIKTADVEDAINQVTNIVYDRQHDNYMYKVEDCEPDYELTADDFKKAMNKFINVLNLTMPKYIPILYQYKQNYEDILRKVESESESFARFNDTPQNEQDEVDYNTPEYATNMGKNKSVSKVDSNSLPLKLKELQENFKSIILEWSNEFDMIFIDEYQLGGF